MPVSTASSDARAEPSCDPTDLAGCIDLAFAHHEGRGAPKDDQAFLRLLTQACSMGEPRACANLGAAFDRGDGVAKDRDRARKLFEWACSGGNIRACLNRGHHYEKLQDQPTEAARFFQQACSLMDGEGCYNVGRLREIGAIGDKDETGALAMYETACVAKYGEGCSAAGRILEASGMVKPAHELFTKACNLYDVEGCLALAGQYEVGRGVEQNYRRAAELYQPMCEAGEAVSCAALGRLVEKGLGGPGPNVALAAELYAEACKLRHPVYSLDGCRRLAQLKALGQGVRKDPSGAQEIFAWLCEQGASDECRQGGLSPSAP